MIGSLAVGVNDDSKKEDPLVFGQGITFELDGKRKRQPQHDLLLVGAPSGRCVHARVCQRPLTAGIWIRQGP